MVELQQTPRKVTRRVLRALAAHLVSLLVAAGVTSTAHAIPYFNETFGFDNTELGLNVDYEVSLDAVFPFIESGTPGLPVSFEAVDDINDTASSVDRTVTWTITNNAKLPEFVLFLTAIGPNTPQYNDFDFNVDIGPQFGPGQASTQGLSDLDPMVIARYGPYFFAGYHLSLEDFAADGTAVRTFRYSVDSPLLGSPPDLGVAYTTMISVPEPATGLLFASAMLLAVAAGRRQHQ
jgi:hypothetical protein